MLLIDGKFDDLKQQEYPLQLVVDLQSQFITDYMRPSSLIKIILSEVTHVLQALIVL
jgi:hypothetical protein